MKVTGETITDEQIRFERISRGCYATVDRRFFLERCSQKRGLGVGARWKLSERGRLVEYKPPVLGTHRRGNNGVEDALKWARARCAEIWNARHGGE